MLSKDRQTLKELLKNAYAEAQSSRWALPSTNLRYINKPQPSEVATRDRVMMFYKAAGKDYMDDTVHCDEVNWIEQDLIKTLQFIMCRGSRRAGHSRGPLLLLAQRKRFVFPTLVDLCCTAIRRAVTVIDQAALLKLPDELADRLAEALTPKKTSPPSDHEPELLVVKHGKLHRFVPPPAVDLILAGTKPSTGRLGDERFVLLEDEDNDLFKTLERKANQFVKMHALCEQLLRDMVCLYSLVEHMCDDGIEAYPTDTMENWRGGRGGGLNQKPATPEDEPTEYQQVFECDENNLVMSVASGAVRLTTFDTSSLVSFRLTVYEPGIDLGLIIANTPEEHSDAYDYEKRPGACVWTSKVVAVLHRGI